MSSTNDELLCSPPPLKVLHSLYLSINQAACASVSPSVLQGSSVDKIQLAMFVSLFAVRPFVSTLGLLY
jgi:hypothetical protein